LQPVKSVAQISEVQATGRDGLQNWTMYVSRPPNYCAPDQLYPLQRDPDNFHMNPTMHLSHLIRILGPSIFTLYKHVLGRRRILIFTLPPVEAACNLCQVAADLCFDNQLEQSAPSLLIDDLDDTMSTWTAGTPPKLKGKCKDGLKVLGMITLNDMDRLDQESEAGTGWIACECSIVNNFALSLLIHTGRHYRRHLPRKALSLRSTY
jgi:hypothetical protein